jgi:deoxycytidylate deaminase
MNQSRQVSAPLQLNGRRAVEVDLSQTESLYRELAARVTVEEAENDRQDTDIEGVTSDLTTLTDTVAAFSNEFSAANIRTDNITAIGFDTDISVGASLLPTTAALVGPIHSLGNETHEWKTVHAEETLLVGTSLSNTLGGLKGDIDEIEGLTTDLTTLTDTVTGFADEFSASNIRTDNITAIGFDTDISVGASLLPTTAALVGPIYSLGSETHEWKTVHAEEVMLAGTSLSNTLGELREDIDAIEDQNLEQHLKIEGF